MKILSVMIMMLFAGSSYAAAKAPTDYIETNGYCIQAKRDDVARPNPILYTLLTDMSCELVVPGSTCRGLLVRSGGTLDDQTWAKVVTATVEADGTKKAVGPGIAGEVLTFKGSFDDHLHGGKGSIVVLNKEGVAVWEEELICKSRPPQ